MDAVFATKKKKKSSKKEKKEGEEEEEEGEKAAGGDEEEEGDADLDAAFTGSKKKKKSKRKEEGGGGGAEEGGEGGGGGVYDSKEANYSYDELLQRMQVLDPPTHPPTHPKHTAAHSHRLTLLHPPTTHPPIHSQMLLQDGDPSKSVSFGRVPIKMAPITLVRIGTKKTRWDNFQVGDWVEEEHAVRTRC